MDKTKFIIPLESNIHSHIIMSVFQLTSLHTSINQKWNTHAKNYMANGTSSNKVYWIRNQF